MVIYKNSLMLYTFFIEILTYKEKLGFLGYNGEFFRKGEAFAIVNCLYNQRL
jgi:hypothetical protein